ncbi:Acyl transferase/acyl hydrolase/lysophospholipase [Penicillium cinerascens]|uniref:Acyl transferase/acyl hydrolase/lysophospholipase n=1 Tax=Penicillium cinerascens TaxID=70096 RepID=A0A9W9NCE1_9EURO|nr:Acyl transferase/acyl hydrolase/lysophospholipase [Penicillium cinerascens]KAJ5216368.1 Acyl transferase/acyl hydrolase/lysophospholipase [Penicillium cinerascens]
MLPHAILTDIVTRKERDVDNGLRGTEGQRKKLTGQDLSEHVRAVVKQCVSKTLSIPEEEVDDRVALTEMGMDSVMAANFRMNLQHTLPVCCSNADK